MRRWAEQAPSRERGELELLMLQSAFGEYLAQLSGGIAISQVEIVRPGDLGLDAATLDTAGRAQADRGEHRRRPHAHRRADH